MFRNLVTLGVTVDEPAVILKTNGEGRTTTFG